MGSKTAVKEDKASANDEKAQFKHIPVARIVVRDAQPREYFDEEKLAQLRASVAKVGIKTPVQVEKVPAEGPGKPVTYRLTAGERRLRVALELGLETIPAMVSGAISEADAWAEALDENLNRDDMSDLEYARAFNKLVTEYEWTIDQIAERYGWSREKIQYRIDLLGLIPELQDLLDKKQIGLGPVWYVCRLDVDQQHAFLKKWVRGEFARATDAEAYAQACREGADKDQGLFPGPQEEMTEPERKALVRKKAETKSLFEKLAPMGEILAKLAAMDETELARLLHGVDGGPAAHRLRLGELQKQISKVQAKLRKAAGITAAAGVDGVYADPAGQAVREVGAETPDGGVVVTEVAAEVVAIETTGESAGIGETETTEIHSGDLVAA